VTIPLPVGSDAIVTSAMIDGGSSDNCGGITFEITPNTFSCNDLGENKVTVTITDDFGNSTIEEITITVTNSGIDADFDAIDDARRVRSLVDAVETTISKGFTIFLTNDRDYWMNNAQRTMSKNFALIENRKFSKSEELDWHSKSLNVNSVSTNRMAPYAPIQIDFNDEINWYDFSKIDNAKSGIFRFFVFDVNN
jgi:hypothetical protein